MPLLLVIILLNEHVLVRTNPVTPVTWPCWAVLLDIRHEGSIRPSLLVLF